MEPGINKERPLSASWGVLQLLVFEEKCCLGGFVCLFFNIIHFKVDITLFIFTITQCFSLLAFFLWITNYNNEFLWFPGRTFTDLYSFPALSLGKKAKSIGKQLASRTTIKHKGCTYTTDFSLLIQSFWQCCTLTLIKSWVLIFNSLKFFMTSLVVQWIESPANAGDTVFDPLSRKISPLAEQQSPCATATEPEL